MDGILYVVTGPSGAGKSSIIKKALEIVEGFAFSISYTTRKQRPGEIDGKDYFFISDEKFEELNQKGEFLEYAKVHSNYYATSKTFIKEKLSEGFNIVLDVDVVGALNIKKEMPEQSVLIFIAPPSYEELERRLKTRGTEKQEEFEVRLNNSKKEIKQISHFDYLIVNQNLSESINQLISIIISEQLKLDRVSKHLGKYTFFKQTFNKG
jgi:guanylate kinase